MPLTRFLPALLVSAFTSFALTPLALRLARRLGFVDRPGARKLHLAPVPLLGGLAMYLALLAGGLVALTGAGTLRELLGFWAGATLLVGLGLWDDRRALRPAVKVGGQCLAAGLLILGGIQVRLLGGAWDALLSLLWVVGICNALNLMDNMDGLAAGVAAIASGWFLLLAAGQGQALVGTLAAALLGASLGFLYYNLSPATIFMGDAGSLVLGFLLAVLGVKLRFPGHPLASTWSAPILVLGVPILDTALVVISRWRRGQPFWLGGKDHFSHRLVARGVDRGRAVFTLYLLAGLAGALAHQVSASPPLVANLLFAGAVLLGAGLIGWAETGRAVDD